MTNRSMDRRSQRTRRMLKKGLEELLQEKPFSQITIHDITDRMDMHRSTFYLHYPNTHALLQELEDDVLSDAQAMVDQHRHEITHGTLRPIFQPILQYIAKNQILFVSLFANNDSSSFVVQVEQLIYKNGSSLILQLYPNAPKEKMDYLLGFLASGLIGLIKTWFESERKLSQEDLVSMADQMVNAVCQELFGECSSAPLSRGDWTSPLEVHSL